MSKAFFINDAWPIILETDASDYGIGGVLYQKDTLEKVIPIQFVSKSLTGAQLRWSTPEKEMYALYYSLKKLDYLISDVPFIWRTDHKNNTLLRSTGSDKVLRWDLYLQGFQMTKEYIKGEDNEVSDTFSRLCAISTPTEYIHPLIEDFVQNEYLGMCEESNNTQEDIAVLVEPRRLTTDIHSKLSKVHNSIVGHHGVERTMKKLIRLNQSWPSMRVDIMTFIKKMSLLSKNELFKSTYPYFTIYYSIL